MKLSIITINRNNASGLKKTIESVISQSYTDFEYIVIDGASTDESVDIIKSYSDKISYWVSEHDTGIYNAMNKGVLASHGEYVLMLNSGDYLVDKDVLLTVFPFLDGVDIVQGNIIEEHGNIIYRNRGFGKSDISYFDIMKGFFLHQAAFCKRDLFDKNGFFDENYKVIGDTKFFMTCLDKGNASFKYIDVDISNYDISGISAEVNTKWSERKLLENQKMRNELYSHRMNLFFEENDKKIRLYDKLHKKRWIWNIVMLASCLYNILYNQDIFPKKETIKNNINNV